VYTSAAAHWHFGVPCFVYKSDRDGHPTALGVF